MNKFDMLIESIASPKKIHTCSEFILHSIAYWFCIISISLPLVSVCIVCVHREHEVATTPTPSYTLRLHTFHDVFSTSGTAYMKSTHPARRKLTSLTHTLHPLPPVMNMPGADGTQARHWTEAAADGKQKDVIQAKDSLSTSLIPLCRLETGERQSHMKYCWCFRSFSMHIICRYRYRHRLYL